jgi:hypothetical protein
MIYIIYVLSGIIVVGSLMSLGRTYSSLSLPFINESNVYTFLLIGLALLYISTSFMNWTRDVDTICRERERI